MSRPTMRTMVARQRTAWRWQGLAGVGVSAELPVVRPPAIGGLDDPTQPEGERLLRYPRATFRAAPLDLEVGEVTGDEPVPDGAGVVAAVKMQRADLAEEASAGEGVEGWVRAWRRRCGGRR